MTSFPADELNPTASPQALRALIESRRSVRRFLPEMIDRIWQRQIDPGKVFDLQLPLAEAAEGYRAMDERRAIKVLLQP